MSNKVTGSIRIWSFCMLETVIVNKHMAHSDSHTPIVPLSDRVVVRPKTERTTISGIVIPDTGTKEKPGIGEVIAVGPGRRTDAGTLIPVALSVGDTILFSKYSPDEVRFDGEDLLVLREDAILAIVK